MCGWFAVGYFCSYPGFCITNMLPDFYVALVECISHKKQTLVVFMLIHLDYYILFFKLSLTHSRCIHLFFHKCGTEQHACNKNSLLFNAAIAKNSEKPPMTVNDHMETGIHDRWGLHFPQRLPVILGDHQ